MRCERCTRAEPQWEMGTCAECNFALCHECRDILRTPPSKYDCCAAGHVLEKSKRRTAWHCSRCFARSPEGGRFRCGECAVDVCKACVLDAKRALATSVNVCAYGHELTVDESKKRLITCVRCFASYANKPFLQCEPCSSTDVSNIEMCERCVFELKRCATATAAASMSREELLAKREFLAAELESLQTQLSQVDALLAKSQ
eukprot:TRINITY_DN13725_c0_g1_i1.p2 TRINITY_DN13725_c0_g1~~TRINITY_DN13725_c0_g1_i1.p2  ORF type:complete len:202 (+),score=78.94 TRINITY_DN13725_c0_g1_i1:393-998(+)